MKDDDIAETQDDEIIDLSAPGITESSCEFCGKSYWVDPKRCVVMHESPSCPTFDVLDVTSFMAENNRIKLKKQKNRPQA